MPPPRADPAPAEPQLASRVLMVRPASFGANPETAASNAYQGTGAGEPGELARRAVGELEGFAAALAAAGVGVVCLDDTPEPAKPDALFPNNWISFHADGTVVLYPMLAPSRRAEVRPELLERLAREHGLAWPRVVDLTGLAERGAFLEGTGSLVLDRPRRVAFACLSPRTTEEGLAVFAERLGYEVIAFRATDRGAPVYHTNVLMGLGDGFAAACLGAIDAPVERARVRARLAEGGRAVIELDRAQLGSFAGNLLALRAADGTPLVALSDRALAALRPRQRALLEAHGTLVHAPLDTIEAVGGGSARCMLAELHAPAR